jgi:hypothetical protein
MTNKKEWIVTEEVMHRLDCLLKHLCSTDSYSMTEDEYIDFKKKFGDVVTDIYQNRNKDGFEEFDYDATRGRSCDAAGQLTDLETETSDVDCECGEEAPDPQTEKDQETRKEFMDAFITCRDIFIDKLKDYGPSWRIFRPQSVTDQLFIKGTRIRSLEELGGVSAVGEGIRPEFCALVNYGIIGLIQLELGYSNTYDMTADEALALYDKYMKIAFELMVKKNHDYDEAWRSMRICSYTDFVLVKLARIKQIEGNGGDSGNSEGVDSNYLDIINYSIFGLIKLNEEETV